MTALHTSAKARLLAAAGIVACAGGIAVSAGCVASGPLSGGKSLSDVASARSNASETKRPAVSASYGDEGEQNAASPSTSGGPSNGAVAGNADSLGGERSSPGPSTAESFSEERFAATLAELPPEESAALRQMLAALREGTQARSTVNPATANPSQETPYVAAPPPESSPESLTGSSRRTAEEFQQPSFVPTDSVRPSVDAFVSRPVSPFVERSLSAFTSTGLPLCQDSPLVEAFQRAQSSLADPSTPRVAERQPSPSREIAQATAISEVVGSGAVSIADAPSDEGPAPDWRAKLSEATRALSVAIDRPGVAEQDRTALEAKLRLLQAIEHRFAESLAPVEGTPEEQAFWKELCGALQELFDPQATPYDDKRATLALRRLDEAARHLGKAADLDVARLAFCTAVDRFGQYEEFPEYVFSPDQETLLYVEVRHFASEPVEQPYPGYRTALEGSYRIVEIGSGKRWDEHAFPVAEEVSKSPRSDYFIAYRVYLPQGLPAGKYRLEFSLRDQVADKHGSGWIDFQVKSRR